ncbi:MAG: nitroreductase/quinone reductase family protein [Mycobacterium sp.]
MTTSHYQEPDAAARAMNSIILSMAGVGISIAGSHALRVRGRKSGEMRHVVVNLMTVDGTDYIVSPRGNTHWARNARAAGWIELGPRWRHAPITIREVADEQKPDLLRLYLKRWFWEVKGHVAGLTPASSPDELRAAAPLIPVFALVR